MQASGGVGGTRIGVKCLHAHLANYLVCADDPVGQLVADDVEGSKCFNWRTFVADAIAAFDCGSNSTRLLDRQRQRDSAGSIDEHHSAEPGR